MNRDVKVIIATAVIATGFAIVMYYTGLTERLMRFL